MDKLSKKIVPLYKFNEHNEAFYFWHKAKHYGYIREPVDVFHIDAHDDMGGGEPFRKSVYFPEHAKCGYLKYYREFSKRELTISGFILPAVLNGLVRNVYFIYPGWRKFKPVRRKMNVSSAFGEGKVLKTNAALQNNANPEMIHKAFPDLRFFNYCSYGLTRVPENKKVILDIDFDYFACRDSISNEINYKLEITREQFLNRRSFLKDNSLFFSGLGFSFLKSVGKYYARIAFRRTRDVSYLPSRNEIRAEIDSLISVLRARETMPVAITLCRSLVSGYCPKDYCGFIESHLEMGLINLFGAKIMP